MTPKVPGPHPAVVYFGGRSEEVSWVVRDAGKLFPGMAVLAVNYRGYGDSHGDPAEEHMVEDGCMLFDWMAERPTSTRAASPWSAAAWVPAWRCRWRRSAPAHSWC
jgi:alpha/beta superfamily hydrolase